MQTLKLGKLIFLLLLILSCNRSSQPSSAVTADTVEELYVRTADTYVQFAPSSGLFPLFQESQLPPLLYDANDHPGVIRVIGQLAGDLEKVTGRQPAQLQALPQPSVTTAIIAGTLGQSTVIDQLVKTKKLDLTALQGKWEKFYLTTVDHPTENIEKALVIIGSDKRGTIYGLYDLCEKIGVSPWNWWADVPVEQRDYLGVKPGLYTDGEPKVKYRGIFINDEAPALSGWVQDNFGKFNHEFYAKVFELILRLKGNYLWPAMWGRSIYDDDPKSPELADEYGVVLGTSHHEPLSRAHVEWERYGEGEWNYNTNPKKLEEFWREGIRRMGDNESIVSVGMRGDGDMPMSAESNIALLEKIVADQRKIIAEETGKPVEATPQMWALYKEVQDYYDKGMRVPDDVTLLLCDDNWGNIRKLPKPGAAPRSGGYGIYYHFDYVGGPRNYKWINTNNIARVWEQMHMAYEHEVRQVWVVNVGDIKPMELPIDFFLDLAWNPELIDQEGLNAYTGQWAIQQFNGFRSQEIAHLLETYTKYNSRRKHELLNVPSYSLTNYDEFRKVTEDYMALEQQAFNVLQDIPAAYHDAYYQLVYFPIAASANMYQLYLAHYLNQWYAQQGRASANHWADLVGIYFTRDSLLTYYHNNMLADGKWNHLMDQTHIGYTYWQQPPKNTIPKVTRLELPETGGLGVWLPQQAQAVQRDSFNMLPTLDPNIQPTAFIELFNTGLSPIIYEASADQTWVSIGEPQGSVKMDKRLHVMIDWAKIPNDRSSHTASITIEASDESRTVVRLSVDPTQATENSYAEKNGIISIKAEQGYQAHNSRGIQWQPIPNYGRTGDGMKAFPTTISIAPDQLNADSPHLTYNIAPSEAGTYEVALYIGPTIDFYDQGGLRLAVSVDEETPQVLNIHDPEIAYNWSRSVSSNVNVVHTSMDLSAGKHTLKLWHIDPGIVYEKIVLSKEGMQKRTYLGPPETYVGGRE